MFARAVVLGMLMTASTACVSSSPGVARTTADNPLVTIGAGKAEVGVGTSAHVWYMIDKRTETCWMYIGEALAPLDCCALRRVSEAQPYLTWASCPGNMSSPSAITPGSPAPGAAAPARSLGEH